MQNILIHNHPTHLAWFTAFKGFLDPSERRQSTYRAACSSSHARSLLLCSVNLSSTPLRERLFQRAHKGTERYAYFFSFTSAYTVNGYFGTIVSDYPRLLHNFNAPILFPVYGFAKRVYEKPLLLLAWKKKVLERSRYEILFIKAWYYKFKDRQLPTNKAHFIRHRAHKFWLVHTIKSRLGSLWILRASDSSPEVSWILWNKTGDTKLYRLTDRC